MYSYTYYTQFTIIYFLPRLAVGLHTRTREGKLLSMSSWNFLLHKNESIEHMKSGTFIVVKIQIRREEGRLEKCWEEVAASTVIPWARTGGFLLMLQNTGYEVSWNVASLGRIICFDTGHCVLAMQRSGFQGRKVTVTEWILNQGWRLEVKERLIRPAKHAFLEITLISN